jgi:hypothetical protein
MPLKTKKVHTIHIRNIPPELYAKIKARNAQGVSTRFIVLTALNTYLDNS